MTPPDSKLHSVSPAADHPSPAHPGTAHAPASPRDVADVTPSERRGRKRGVLVGVGAIAAIALVWFGVRTFLARGDESTDDAFVEADVVAVAPRVGGPIAEVLVAENAHVKKDEVLFRIDDADYQVRVRQAEAELATAQQRRASARSALALLAGDAVADGELATPVEALPVAAHVPGDAAPPEDLPELVAARRQRDAGDAAVSVARGSLLPALFAQASAETMREANDLSSGASWVTLGVVLRWDLSVADAYATRAARARARAASEALSFRERQASRELGEARRAVETADARARSAEEAVVASQAAQQLRVARHREGLLPLTDVLDAEAALAGARALLLASRLEARVSRARLSLALNQPIEGVTP